MIQYFKDHGLFAFDGKELDLHLIDLHYCVDWLIENGQ